MVSVLASQVDLREEGIDPLTSKPEIQKRNEVAPLHNSLMFLCFCCDESLEDAFCTLSPIFFLYSLSLL